MFFDNLYVLHKRGTLLEETHYYPFGLTMNGISSKALNRLENKYRFNEGSELQNKEFSDGSGLDLYDSKYRLYDAQIGRFHQGDPLADFFEDLTVYNYAFNNPLLFNDPLGLSPDGYTGWIDPGGGDVYFDPNVHKQEDIAPGGGTFLGEEIYIKNENGDRIGFGNDQGGISFNVDLAGVTITAGSNRRQPQADWLSTSNMLAYAGGDSLFMRMLSLLDINLNTNPQKVLMLENGQRYGKLMRLER